MRDDINATSFSPYFELIDGCEVVPAGIVELIRLQQEGFAYIKP